MLTDTIQLRIKGFTIAHIASTGCVNISSKWSHNRIATETRKGVKCVMPTEHTHVIIQFGNTGFEGFNFSLQLYSIKGNGAVYKDLNLARASRRAINRHVT